MNNHFDQHNAVTNASVINGIKARRFSVPLVTMAALLTLAGCSNGQDDANDDATQVTADAETTGEVLRIGTEGAYAPFNYTNTDGTLGGFDVDIANALCADMKMTCEITAQDWDGIIPGLKAGKYDAIVAAMSVTPEREQQVSFTEPYFSNTLVFLAKKDSSFDPSNSSDINANSIAAQRSTISSQWFEKAYPDADMKLYDTLSNAFLDLGSNRVDAMVSDKLPALEWLGSTSGSQYALKGEEIDINDNFAIAVRPGDELQAKISQALANIKANGTYDDINNKYFAVPETSATKATETDTVAEPAEQTK
ncbi:ABC transporter substrate-binding protein [Psychrobacter sp. NZS113]|uniref:ABC transporter substrate-binding protein n=1 Tax=Psychrobacter sp. NZS113 TaxID=2792045 RepID=UPI0018CCC9BF|nr:ABC transporter substrate-binding protein [Psychrobacter sp. NZS113]MBH0095219.1 ABC transporter substrate-binding protein [Psychrobacter sp. NZS113]